MEGSRQDPHLQCRDRSLSRLRRAVREAARRRDRPREPGLPAVRRTSAGCSRRELAQGSIRRRATPTRIARTAARRDRAHAAEIVVLRRPGACTRSRPPRARSSRRARSRARGGRFAGGMEARPRDRVLRPRAPRRARPRRPGRARCAAGSRRPRRPRAAGRPVRVERDGRRHHARHPGAGLELAAKQVGLAEHAVQVQVEAGEEVPRAEPEARREHADVPVRVDDGQVRGVRRGGRSGRPPGRARAPARARPG